MKNNWTLGTRGSLLAVTQTEDVQRELQKKNPGNEFSIQKIKTTGDIQKAVPIGELNLKGAFTKELDDALFQNKIDLAIHSLKDLPSQLPPGLWLAAVALVEDPRDALLTKSGVHFKDLPKGAKVGTASSRRTALVYRLRPDLTVELLRGNVDTRLQKLDQGEFDAIIVAAAGLTRLGKKSLITEYLNPLEFVPSVGQGKLAIVCRSADTEVLKILSTVDNSEAHQMVLAQRAFMAAMDGGCSIPLGCYGEVKGDQLHLVGFLGLPNGTKFVQKEAKGSLQNPISLGVQLAKEILSSGGKEILVEIQKK